MFHIETLTKNYVRVPSGAVNVAFTPPAVSGYTPVGVIGFSTNNNHQIVYEVTMVSTALIRMSMQGDSNSSTATTTASITVLYIRDS